MKKLLILLVLAGIAYFYFSQKQQFIQPQVLSQVLNKLPQQQQAISLNKNTAYLSSPQANTIQKQILGIQQQVGQLNKNDVASAPPQIQDILKQIQNIPQGTINQIKEQCINICKKL